MIYFISGHRDLTQEEFNYYYIPLIEMALNDKKSIFLVGDYDGADIMAQKYLNDNIDNIERVVVYHIGGEPMNIANKNFPRIGGWKDDIERDTAMTKASVQDIAWIRKGKENSGTAQNILRRFTFY